MKSIFYQKLKARYNKAFLNQETKKFIKFNKDRFNNINVNSKKGMVLVDFFDHEPWNFFFSDICFYLKKKFNFNLIYSHFILHKSFLSNFYISHHRLNKIYESFSCSKMISKQNFQKIPNKKIINEFKKIKSKRKLERYKYKKILIGDLIYDTYLRTAFEPTINLNNKKFFNIFSDAIKIYECVDTFFQKNNVKLCIPSHTYYIQYGILTRLALYHKIPVVMIHSKGRGKKDLQLKIVVKENPREHNWGYEHYNKNFKKLKNKKKLISIGKKNLDDRLKGKNKLSYLVKSPYKGIQKNLDEKEPKVIIFCHDFFDSTHKYKKMIFPDFYEQLNFLINYISKNTNYKIYIKPHPNHLPENDFIIQNLQKKFVGKVFVLNKNIDNYSLASSKPKFMITNNGTITGEVPKNNSRKVLILEYGSSHLKYHPNDLELKLS